MSNNNCILYASMLVVEMVLAKEVVPVVVEVKVKVVVEEVVVVVVVVLEVWVEET